jgi:hypothetical protein
VAAGGAATQFTLADTGGAKVRTLSIDSTGSPITLREGRYSLIPQSGTTYAGPVTIQVTSSPKEVIRVDRLYGHLSVRPPAGSVAVPGFDLRRSGARGIVGISGSDAQSKAGVYVAPGAYLAAFWPKDYPIPLPVSFAAGKPTVLNLAREYGRLSLVLFRGAPPSGFDVYRAGTTTSLSGINPAQGQSGFFLPAGRYSIAFYNSDAYLDPVTFTIAAGRATLLDLNHVLAAVRAPVLPANSSLSFSWLEGDTLRTIAASASAKTYYIRSGVYRLQITLGLASRVTTLRAKAGTVTNLPAR